MAERKKTTVAQGQSSAGRKKAAASATPRRGRKKSVLPEGTSEQHVPQQSKRFLSDFFRFGESYSSLVLGVIVVVAVAALLVTFARNGLHKSPQQDTSSTSTRITEEQNIAKPGSVYTVEEGDDLWKISEKAYEDGHLWEKIAQANNISDPNQLSVGTRITIPEVEASVHLTVSTTSGPTATVTPTFVPTEAPSATPTVQATPKPTVITSQQPNAPPSSMAGKSYTVVAGDTLWDISVRAYGNGYRWVDIARANHWANPDLIYPGNVFQLPK